MTFTRKHTQEEKQKISLSMKGGNSTSFKIGHKMKEETKKKISADHIKPFAYFPELRFAIDNGRTLCLECHKKTDTYLRKQ